MDQALRFEVGVVLVDLAEQPLDAIVLALLLACFYNGLTSLEVNLEDLV